MSKRRNFTVIIILGLGISVFLSAFLLSRLSSEDELYFFAKRLSDDSVGLYSVKSDGSHLRSIELSADIFSVDYPQFEFGDLSPNRKKLLISRYHYDNRKKTGVVTYYIVDARSGSGSVLEVPPNVYPEQFGQNSNHLFYSGKDAPGEITTSDLLLVPYPDQEGYFLKRFSPSGDHIIAHSHKGNTGRELYVLDSDGTNSRQLTFNAKNPQDYKWSPDGQKIVYLDLEISSGGEWEKQKIMIINTDGSNVRQLFSSNFAHLTRPHWSPDGTGIAYISSEKGDICIKIINLNGQVQSVIRPKDLNPSRIIWTSG